MIQPMAKFSRRTKIIAAFIILVALGYGLALFWQAENGVPASFTAARLQGAIIAQTIVNNSNQSVDGCARFHDRPHQSERVAP